MGLNLSVLPDCFLCLGLADMYVAHILRIELHERVVYQLRRRRFLISLYSRNFDKQFFHQRKSILPGHLNERFVSSRTGDIILLTRSSECFRNLHLESDVPTRVKHRTFPLSKK